MAGLGSRASTKTGVCYSSVPTAAALLAVCVFFGEPAGASGDSVPDERAKRYDAAAQKGPTNADLKGSEIEGPRILLRDKRIPRSLPDMGTYNSDPCNINFARAMCDVSVSIASSPMPTRQSSTLDGHNSSLAINNDVALVKIFPVAVRLPTGTFSQTLTESNPWWLVNLLWRYRNVCAVTVATNMAKYCCGDSVQNLEVRVGSNSAPSPATGFFDNPLCYFRQGAIGARRFEVIHCLELMQGQYVSLQTISAPGQQDFLQFAQVYVHGPTYTGPRIMYGSI